MRAARFHAAGRGEECWMALLVLLGLVAVVGFWLVGAYNGLVALRQRCKQAFSDINVQLKQRHDLVPNLVETVKGYATHEKTTLEDVIKARNAAVSAAGPNAQGAAEGALTGALSRLIALGEAYPDLKANQNFQQLQNELADIENKISAARRFLNNTVAEYNATREAFPGFLIAQRYGFEAMDYFELGETEQKAIEAAPKVQF
jgi:LemA protein